MKKRIFALALALCMLLSVMPTSFAAGLTLGGSEPVSEPVVESSGGLTLGGSVQEEEDEEEPRQPSTGVLTPGGISAEEEEDPAEDESEVPQPPTGVLYTQCAFCGYLDNAHADDCETLRPEEEEPAQEEAPAQQPQQTPVTQEEITTKQVSNYTAETVSTQSTSGSERLTIQRNATAYATLRSVAYDTQAGDEEDAVDYSMDFNTSTAAVADKDTTVKVANDKVTLTKSISDPDANGYYTITLGASTESETVTVKSAANIVLVLDASQSMVDDADTLNDAVDEFLLGASSSKDSKVAIISYSNEAVARTNNTDDGTAFLPISVNDSLNTALLTAVDNVTSATKKTAGTTNVAKLADKGLEKAVDVIHAYNAVYKNDETPVIVVLFTDGVPTKDTTATRIWDKQYDAYGIAQDALHWSTILKGDKGYPVLTEEKHRDQEFYTPEWGSDDHWSRTSDEVWDTMIDEETNVGCGATVYTVGINLPNYWYGGDGAKVNEFMYRASSHVPTSAHEDSDYGYFAYDDSTRNNGYYLVGAMTTDLFDDVEMEGGVSLKNVILRDVLPDYMEVVPGRTDGGTENPENTVEWTNQSITPGPNGALTKTLTVKFKDGFLGGHSVPTNDAASGIYAVDEKTGAETLVGAFGIPTVDVAIPEITVTAVDKNVYLTSDVSAEQLMEGVTAKIGDTSYVIDPTKKNYGLASWQTAYIKSIAFTSAEEDGNFDVTCTITPNDVAVAEGGTAPVSVRVATDSAAINVYYPSFTTDDCVVYLGGSDPEFTTAVDYWYHGSVENTSNSVTMTGDEPVAVNMVFTYSKENDFTDCTSVSVASAKINDRVFSVADDCFNSVDFKVHVRKPTVTFRDTTIYLGDTPDYGTENLTKIISWEDKADTEKGKLIGNAPAITDFTFNYQSDVDHSKCNTVDVTAVKINGVDFTDNVFFANDTTSVTDDVKFTVHVLQPVVTVSLTDTTAYYGDKYDLGTGANGNITLDWNDADQSKTWINPIGDAPYQASDLSLAYAVPGVEGQQIIMPNSDVTVTATVMKDGKTFADSVPTFTTTCSNGCTEKTDGTYVVHPLTCTLTIKNTGWDELDENQSFIFNVVGNNKTYPVSVKVVIDENGEAKIVGLPVGTYTVSADDGDWSWRYATTGDSDTVSSSKPNGKVTVKNVRDSIYWFDAIAETVKNIFGKGAN